MNIPPDLFSEVFLSSYTNSHEFYAWSPVCLFFFSLTPYSAQIHCPVSLFYSVQGCQGLPWIVAILCHGHPHGRDSEKLQDRRAGHNESGSLLLSAFCVHCFWHRLFTVRVIAPWLKATWCWGIPVFVLGMAREMSQGGVQREMQGWKDEPNTFARQSQLVTSKSGKEACFSPPLSLLSF